MKEFIEKLIGRLEEQAEQYRRRGFEHEEKGYSAMADKYYGKQCSYLHSIEIVNQLAEEYKDKSSIIDGLIAFLKEKFDYCAEQAGMNLEAECNSEIASYFRDRKELYLDRANIYGEVMREIDRLAEEHNNGWITDRNPTKEECKNNRFWITDSDRWSYEADFDLECERWRDLERGGFIEVIAWYILPLPAPYQPKGE